MEEISILIGGKAGDGTRLAGKMIAKIFNRYGYYVFVYDDYQSLIRGGHNFSIIRASKKPIKIHKQEIDVLIALDQKTIDLHQDKLSFEGVLIYDSNVATSKKGIGVEMTKIIQERKLASIYRNSLALGFLAKIFNIDFLVIERIIQDLLSAHQKENVEVAKIGYKIAPEIFNLKPTKEKPKQLLTGNEAIALGATKAGLEIYIAYPMTPATSILHFLAKHKDDFGIKIVQPENEIAGILMVEGAVYAGKRAMIGTSGGGFALMTEALSLAGMAELPVVIVLSQRAAPSTGVPTYTMQGDLLFAINAGHGEFQRIVVAPGDAEEAFYLTGEVMDLAWKYQMPAIILADKHLSESTFFAEIDLRKVRKEEPKMWNGEGEYLRYYDTLSGVSPLAFPGDKKAIVKATSYEHDEYGITTEDPQKVALMIEKRKKKSRTLIEELKKKQTVKVSSNKNEKVVLIGWGSAKGVLEEVTKELGFKFVQPLYLEPFPEWEIKKALQGAREIIDVEMNSEGQLAKLLRCYGIKVTHKILKYDARPFTPEELIKKIWQTLK